MQSISKYNDKDAKSKVGKHVRISKYKNMFVKNYPQNWSGEVFVIKKAENTVPWQYVIEGLNSDKSVGKIYEKKNGKVEGKRV